MNNQLPPYDFLKSYLLDKFQKEKFWETWKVGEEQKNNNYSNRNPKVNTKSFNIPNQQNLNLSIQFPGYKTKFENNKITYDYRVSLNDIAISHVNIIIDLYNKAIQLNENAYLINNYLFDLAENGYNYDRQKYTILNNLEIQPPSRELIAYVEDVHKSLNKKHKVEGNRWNYSLDELSYVIMFIVLQEDINYPQPRYLGRRMPFARYLEAVYLAQNPNNGIFSLKDIIDRALTHFRRPTPYILEGLNYY